MILIAINIILQANSIVITQKHQREEKRIENLYKNKTLGQTMLRIWEWLLSLDRRVISVLQITGIWSIGAPPK